eukprot:354470-Chlamydomonas_euryale.AAC.9
MGAVGSARGRQVQVWEAGASQQQAVLARGRQVWEAGASRQQAVSERGRQVWEAGASQQQAVSECGRQVWEAGASRQNRLSRHVAGKCGKLEPAGNRLSRHVAGKCGKLEPASNRLSLVLDTEEAQGITAAHADAAFDTRLQLRTLISSRSLEPAGNHIARSAHKATQGRKAIGQDHMQQKMPPTVQLRVGLRAIV